MYKLSLVLLAASLYTACSNADPETTDLLTNYYPDLYDAVYERDAEAILEFTRSEQARVAEQAWNALISTPAEDIVMLIERAAEANSSSSWASLWFKDLSEEQVQKLHEMWEKPDLRPGIASVLGYHGNGRSLEVLLSEEDHDHELALAIGRLSARLELTPEQEKEVIGLAFAADEPRMSESYLYGFYRTAKELDPATEQLILTLWENYYPENNDPIQMLAGIMMKNHMDEVLYKFEKDDYEWMQPKLAIELTRGIARHELTKQSPVVLNALLENRNVNVRMATLRAIQAKQNELNGQLDNAVLNRIALIRGYEAPLRLEAFNSVTRPEIYKETIYELAGEAPYLQPLKYRISKKFLSSQQFLDTLKSDLEKENRLNRFFALQEIANWWGQLEEKPKALTEEVRSITLEHMNTADRAMIYMMGDLFRDEAIIRNTDYPLVRELLDRFQLPEDVEVFQAVSSVLKDRFEEEAKPLIESLAEEGNSALNQTLRDQGWDIPESAAPETEFRTPDWKQLSKLGQDPVLVLQTNKGDIIIILDVLNAPATIAGMDSLIKARAYSGVPFHRVVANFVIQGGDVESWDGFGGPDYVVPTEASPVHYNRGKMGIASAGTDTEGSQYFIMHQWMPHLTGRYTIVGEVYEGMDVVDRIVVGDYVERAYWY